MGGSLKAEGFGDGECPTLLALQVTSMKLYIAGVNHLDPLCRPKLVKWLQQLSETHDKRPAFVAVEYDKNLFEKAKKQRKRFRQMLQKEWPSLTSEQLNILENSLVYEGDTHLEVFPDVEILWLDTRRQETDSSVVDKFEKYAEDRLAMYKQYSFGEKTLSINQLRERIRNVDDPECIDLDRSQKFAYLVSKGISKSGGKWAIVIVGFNHTRKDIQENMRCLLEDNGLICEVSKICV